MFLFSKEGRDAFVAFMNNLVAQAVFATFCILILYRATQIPFDTNAIIFWLLTLFTISMLVYWCICSFTNLIAPLNNELNQKLKDVGETGYCVNGGFCEACKHFLKKICLAWKHDKKIFFQVFLIFLCFEVPIIYIFISSIFGAAQLAQSLGWQ